MSYSTIIKSYLSVDLDPTNKFFTFQEDVLSTKTVEQCKNPDKKYENQRNLFNFIITKLKDLNLKTFQNDEEITDRTEVKANKIFNIYLQKITESGERLLMSRFKLAEALEIHMHQQFENPPLVQSKGKDTAPSSETKIDEKQQLQDLLGSTSVSLDKFLGESGEKSTDEKIIRTSSHHRRQSSLKGSQALTPTRSVPKLQKGLETFESQYKEALSKIDDETIKAFQNFWKENKPSSTYDFISKYETKPALYPQLQSLCDVPLMGLSCEERTTRMLQNLTSSIGAWAQDLGKQLPFIYVLNGKEGKIDFSLEKSDEECFKNYTRAFRLLLENLLEKLPLSKHPHLKEMVLNVWENCVLETKKKDMDNTSLFYCIELFLDKVIHNKFFTKDLLDTYDISDVFFLNSLSKCLGHLLLASRQDVYVITCEEIGTYFKSQGYSYTYQSGQAGRSIEYFFEPSGNVVVEGKCEIKFNKTNSEPFSVFVHNTLRSSVTDLTKWESKISLQVYFDRNTSSDQKMKGDKKVSLMMLGFTV